MAVPKTQLVVPKTKILIVDDKESSRDTTRFLIEEQFGYPACSPHTPDELRKVIAFEAFDSALVDFDLNDWREKLEHYKLDDLTVRNGNDIANFLRQIHDVSTVGVYTTKAPEVSARQKRKDIRYISLPKLTSPDMESFKEKFRLFLEETDSVRKLIPVFSPADFQNATVSKQLKDYKQVCRLNEKWVNFSFDVVGDFSWAIICNRRIEHYGNALNGNKAADYGISKLDEYPSQEELAEMARSKNAASFVLWNTRMDLIDKQFDLAGRHLDQIPEYLQDFFSLAIAKLCAEAYEKGNEKALPWCKWLKPAGQIEMLKLIYKRVGSGERRDHFIAECESLRLPAIIEVYKSTVDEIDEESNTAWVEMIPWYEYRPTRIEEFDLEKLHEQGVRYKNQEFEYTLYETYTADEASNIEFIEAPERNPFDTLM